MNADKTLLTPLCKRLGATLSRRGMLFVGLGIVIIMSAAALLAPWLSPYDPTALHLKSILVPPSAQFPLGTDALGRDVLSRLLYGARVSLWVGFVSVSISIAIGIALGLLAGYFRGIVDEIIMRGVDVMLCFPSFFLILAVIAFLEPSLNTIMVVIGLTSWMGVARLVRAEPSPCANGILSRPPGWPVPALSASWSCISFPMHSPLFLSPPHSASPGPFWWSLRSAFSG